MPEVADAVIAAGAPTDLPGPLLAIDTSTHLAIAVLDRDSEPVVRTVDAPRRHAELLAPLIDEALRAAGCGPSDLAAVAVGTGPATFTGLRVGLMTARAFAYAAQVPLWGVASLDVTALDAARAFAPREEEIVVVRDAKRREVFAAGYRVSGAAPHTPDDPAQVRLQRTFGPLVAAPSDIPVAAGARRFVGDVDAARDYGLPNDSSFLETGSGLAVDPALLGLIAVARANSGAAIDATPLYLRRPDVQEPSTRKRTTQ